MLCLEPSVVDAVWHTIRGMLPPAPPPDPRGGRPRVDDRACFTGIMTKLVSGLSWKTIGQLGNVSEGTLRRRWNAWVDAGVMAEPASQSVAGYDRLIGYDTSAVLLDGSTQKAPRAGEDTGRNPTDRGRRGYKWSLATDAEGTPVAAVTGPANLPDFRLAGETLAAVRGAGLLAEGAALRADKGYDYPEVDALLASHGMVDRVRRRRRKGDPVPERKELLGRRWAVERANSWLTNFGQLRRATDRVKVSRDAWLALAMALILVVKLTSTKHLRAGL